MKELTHQHLESLGKIKMEKQFILNGVELLFINVWVRFCYDDNTHRLNSYGYLLIPVDQLHKYNSRFKKFTHFVIDNDINDFKALAPFDEVKQVKDMNLLYTVDDLLKRLTVLGIELSKQQLNELNAATE